MQVPNDHKINNIHMKKSLIYILMIAGFSACDDRPFDFPDYDLQAVYFPLQLPVRTLSLGEDRVDNALDKELKFDIGIAIGGMYENKQDWTVKFIVDTALTTKVTTTGTLPVLPLPENYYTLIPDSIATIPSGSFVGRIRVELTEDFLNDPIALSGRYVIPLRLTDTNADSILSGKPDPLFPTPDRRITNNWIAGKTPKDWVMFGIKYVNAYHGTYLQRGMDILYQGGIPVDTVIYRKKYIEQDQLVKLTTTAKDTVVTNGIANKITSGANKYGMKLAFTNLTGASGSINISPVTGSIYSVTGTGQYFDKASSVEGFSELIFQSIHLNYTYVDGITTHQVSDTLVFRDRGIIYESLFITVQP